MFEAFIWMFKNENFRKHVQYLVFTLLKFFIPAIFLLLIKFYFSHLMTPTASLIVTVTAWLLYITPFLCLQGYFWELTGNIISREWDIKAASIYNGKIKNVYKITLPEIHTLKFIWRGIASVVANILMSLPLVSLLIVSGFLGALGIKFLGTDIFSNASYPAAMLIAFLMYWFLVPAFLWNYANRDSVVAVWNLRKAIYIAGNYTGKYILNSTVFCLYNLVVSIVISGIEAGLSFGNLNITNPIGTLSFLVTGLVLYFIYTYSIYVNAYLLGTIAPPHEG